MYRLLLPAILLIGACEQRPPIPVTYVPATSAPAAANRRTTSVC